MSSRKVHINELRLRAPGLSRAQAQRLGKLVAKELAEKPMTVIRSRTMRSLSLKVNSDADSVEGMATKIAGSIRKAVK